MKFLLLSLLLTSCSYFHTKASRERAKLEETAEGVALPSYTYATTDLLHVSNVMVSELQNEGFKITYVDLKSGKISAETRDKAYLASFNSGFSSGRNYKVADSLVVDVQLGQLPEGVRSAMTLKKVETFSMGQEESHDLNSSALHAKLFSKVKLAL